MSTPTEFGRPAAALGEQTELSLAEILGSDPETFAEQLRGRLDRIRAAEREAERDTAGIRLY